MTQFLRQLPSIWRTCTRYHRNTAPKLSRYYTTELSSLPGHSRVVICGGGVVGCSVAYHLAKLGWNDIVLLEQGRYKVKRDSYSAQFSIPTCITFACEVPNVISLYCVLVSAGVPHGMQLA